MPFCLLKQKTIFFTLENGLKLINYNVCRVLSTDVANCTECHWSHIWRNGPSPSTISFMDGTSDFVLSSNACTWFPFPWVQTKRRYIINPTPSLRILLPTGWLHICPFRFVLYPFHLRLASCRGLFHPKRGVGKMHAKLSSHRIVVSGMAGAKNTLLSFLENLQPGQPYFSRCYINCCDHEELWYIAKISRSSANQLLRKCEEMKSY